MEDLKLMLCRIEYAGDGVWGYIDLPSGIRIYTAEPSRPGPGGYIPEGTYPCRPRRYHRGGYDAIEIADVPGRKYILFHKGNWPIQSRGCVLVGMRRGILAQQRALVNSRDAFEALMQRIPTELTIKEAT